MGAIDAQYRSMSEKNGRGVLTFTTDGHNQLANARVNQNDVFALCAYWFEAMIGFFKDLGAYPAYWAVARRSGEKWIHEVGADSITRGIGLITLEDYLALPPYNWLSTERSGDSAYALDDRFMVRPHVSGMEACALVRANCEKDRKYYSSGTVWTLYTEKQSSRDGAQVLERYIRDMMKRWEALIAHVSKTSMYNQPSTTGEIWKFADDKQSRAFWQCIADIASDIDRQGDIIKSMPSWDTWLSDSAHRVKAITETTVKKGAEVAGETAAWAANTAGEAAGKAGQGFLRGIGLWGIAFVALIIYTR